MRSNNSISGMVTRARATFKLEVVMSSFPKKSCTTYMSHVPWGMTPFPALGNKYLTFHVSLQNPVCPQAFLKRRQNSIFNHLPTANKVTRYEAYVFPFPYFRFNLSMLFMLIVSRTLTLGNQADVKCANTLS